MFCTHCGTQIDEGRSQKNCGASIAKVDEPRGDDGHTEGTIQFLRATDRFHQKRHFAASSSFRNPADHDGPQAAAKCLPSLR